MFGLESFSKEFSVANVMREYNKEKWGEQLKEIIKLKMNGGGGYDDLLDLHLQSFRQKNAILVEDCIVEMNGEEIYQHRAELLKRALQKYEIENLVELGAGNGLNMFLLAKIFTKTKGFYAGEYTSNGVTIIKEVAKNSGIGINVSKCDLTAENIYNGELPENCVFFTCHAIEQCYTLTSRFIDAMLKLKPSIVIHFEPCCEYFDENSLLGLMQKKYNFINKYNFNLANILNDAQNARKIQIIEVEKNVLGNPFNPTSIISWKPLL
jgi:hypothetical protein